MPFSMPLTLRCILSHSKPEGVYTTLTDGRARGGPHAFADQTVKPMAEKGSGQIPALTPEPCVKAKTGLYKRIILSQSFLSLMIKLMAKIT